MIFISEIILHVDNVLKLTTSVSKARSPGRAKLAKAPPPVARGGWAQVELTDALAGG